MIEHFSNWLETTPISATLKAVSWAIPLLQIIHILGIAVAFSSICLISARLAGFNRQMDTDDLLRTNLRLFWPAALVLLFTGTLLVVSEPGRDLPNPAFQIKILIFAVGISAVYLLNKRLKSNYSGTLFQKLSGKQKLFISLVLVSIFTAIIICGRWIAYFDAGNN